MLEASALDGAPRVSASPSFLRAHPAYDASSALTFSRVALVAAAALESRRGVCNGYATCPTHVGFSGLVTP
jgi:hypothetical protein